MSYDAAFRDHVVGIIADYVEVDPSEIDEQATFDELGIDSLDGVNIVFDLESEYDVSIPNDEAMNISSVKEMLESFHRLIQAKQAGTATS